MLRSTRFERKCEALRRILIRRSTRRRPERRYLIDAPSHVSDGDNEGERTRDETIQSA